MIRPMTPTFAPTDDLFWCEDRGITIADVFKLTKRLVTLAAGRGSMPQMTNRRVALLLMGFTYKSRFAVEDTMPQASACVTEVLSLISPPFAMPMWIRRRER